VKMSVVPSGVIEEASYSTPDSPSRTRVPAPPPMGELFVDGLATSLLGAHVASRAHDDAGDGRGVTRW